MITVFSKASLPMERGALVAFIAKVEGVVIKNFSGGKSPSDSLLLFSPP